MGVQRGDLCLGSRSEERHHSGVTQIGIMIGVLSEEDQGGVEGFSCAMSGERGCGKGPDTGRGILQGIDQTAMIFKGGFTQGAGGLSA